MRRTSVDRPFSDTRKGVEDRKTGLEMRNVTT